MNRKENVQSLIQELANEVYAFIKDNESSSPDGWVPAIKIKNELELNFVCVPKAGKQYGPKGWVFAAIARILEEQDRISYKNDGKNAFCKTK